MVRRCLILLVLVLCGSAGCGYQLTGSGSVLPEDIKTIAVLPVDNASTEPGLGPQFTDNLREQFERYGVVKVTEDSKGADAVLKVKITKVDEAVRNVRGQTDVEVANDVVVTVSAELRRRTGQLLWKDDSLRVTQPYAGVSDIVVTGSSAFMTGDVSASQINSLSTNELSRGQKDQALSDILQEAARQIYTESVAADF